MNRSTFVHALAGCAALAALAVAQPAMASSPSISASVTDGDPSTVKVSGNGFTPGGQVFVGVWDPTLSEWTTSTYVTASTGFFGGLILNVQLDMDCSDNDQQYAYAYDEDTSTYSNGVGVTSSCTE